MQKNSFMKLLGVALAASLLLSGCDNGGEGVVATNVGGGGTTVTTGGGGTSGGVTGTTGFGLTGGTLNLGGGSGGSGTTITGGGTTTTTTTTTTGGSTGSSNFLNAINPVDFRTGLNNPTTVASVRVSGVSRAVIVDGFRLGQANGRVLVLDDSGTFDPATGGFPILNIQRSQASTFTGSLTSPFDVVSDGNSLYVSAGFDAFGEGAIIKISNLTLANGTVTGTWQNLTQNSQLPNNPAFLTLVGTSGGVYVYWTEYTSVAGNGRVRRIIGDGSQPAEDVITTLNFPAGLDHDGSSLVVCEAGGGGSSLGRVIVAPLNATTTLNGQNSNEVTEVTTATGEQPIRRPFDVIFDGNNGFFFTEGAALSASGSAPGSSGQGNGAVRFMASGQTSARLVSNGLDPCAGIDAFDADGDGTTAVVFSENMQSTGKVQRRLVDTGNVTLAAPTPVQTGLFSPLSVGLISETLPSVLAVINYNGGQSNGSVRVWGP